ncbi:MAG: insulinase family protein [Clostridia bacterium]|nr:insulinase family protein [Clostridia bacterium]
MNYQKQEIKEGINLHTIKTNKFKTNLLSVFITTPLVKENITKQALISSVLRRGSKTMPTSEEISITLEEMYGASFDCGIDKIGNNHIIKLYLETINDEFLPEKNDILQKAINTILEIAFNPLVENGTFKEEYVKTEKENLKQIIEGKKDNKAKYSLDRCIEEMYKGMPYGLYKFGNVEDLEELTAKELYNYYKEMIKQCKIDIFISGKIDEKEIIKIVTEDENIKILDSRSIVQHKMEKLPIKQEPDIVKESIDVTQGKLVLGLNIENANEESKYIALVYNMILGGGANSKLFQNVREKASLAYTAGSNYIRQVNNIFIRCGIEIKNFDKALDIIKKQLEDIKNGEFTDADLQNAKQTIISTIKFIPDEQDTEVTYYFGQELSNNKVSFEEYIEKVKSVTKEQIVELAKSIKIDTIYFLTNE